MASKNPLDYQGRLLRVDLSQGEVRAERMENIRDCLGSACLGARVLYEEVPPEVGWDNPENRFIIASGPLGGIVPGSGTFSVISKGPMTEGAGVTQASGFFGAYLRQAGFDAIVVQGQAPKLTYLFAHNGVAELRDASALAGKDTWETGDLIRQELKMGRELSVVSIGPAGENRVRFAGVFGDRGHASAHNGVGAVLGAKNLKAIAVADGRVGIPLKDPKALLAVSERVYHTHVDDPTGGLGIFLWGTLNGVLRNAEGGATLPLRNYTSNVWAIDRKDLERYSGPYIRNAFQAVLTPCFACFMHHCHQLRVPDGPHQGKLVDEPEYEGLAAFGPVIGQTDVTWAIVLNDLADRLGLDVNECGWVVALAMECFEKGLLTLEDTDGLELRWGNAAAAEALLRQVAQRKGLGQVMAEGAMRAARLIGGDAPSFAIHTAKGNTPRGHDHRGMWAEMFDTSISNTGTLESGGMVTRPLGQALNLPRFDRFSPEGVATLNALMKGAMTFEDSLGVCRFVWNSDIKLLIEALDAAVGWSLSVPEAMAIGRRAVNRLRVFNLRHGISPELDRPSARYGSTPVDGPVKDHGIGPHWDGMLKLYYEKMGWDEQGRPKPETLRALGLEDALPLLRGS